MVKVEVEPVVAKGKRVEKRVVQLSVEMAQQVRLQVSVCPVLT